MVVTNGSDEFAAVSPNITKRLITEFTQQPALDSRQVRLLATVTERDRERAQLESFAYESGLIRPGTARSPQLPRERSITRSTLRSKCRSGALHNDARYLGSTRSGRRPTPGHMRGTWTVCLSISVNPRCSSGMKTNWYSFL
jgi:hypothetical protein